jgi:hypothetical protein
MTVTLESRLDQLAPQAAVKDILARMGLIHCTGCSVPEQTVRQAADSAGLPAEILVNALQAATGAKS